MERSLEPGRPSKGTCTASVRVPVLGLIPCKIKKRDTYKEYMSRIEIPYFLMKWAPRETGLLSAARVIIRATRIPWRRPTRAGSRRAAR